MLQFGEDICWVCSLSITLHDLIYKRVKALSALPLLRLSPFSFHPVTSLPRFPSRPFPSAPTVWTPGAASRETEAVGPAGAREAPRREGPGARLARAPPEAAPGAGGE